MRPYSINQQLSYSLAIAMALTLVACGTQSAQELSASEAAEIQYGLSEGELSTAEQVDGFLATSTFDVPLSADNVLSDREVAFEVGMEGGTLHIELGWDQENVLADLLNQGDAQIRLRPESIQGFAGAMAETSDMEPINRSAAGMHIVGHYHRTLCGVRRLVADGVVEYSDGTTEWVRIGLGWTEADSYGTQSGGLTASSKEARKKGSKGNPKGISSHTKPTSSKPILQARKPKDLTAFGCPLSPSHPNCDGRDCKIKVQIGEWSWSKKGYCGKNLLGTCFCILWTLDLNKGLVSQDK